jgi:hypothetical protein
MIARLTRVTDGVDTVDFNDPDSGYEIVVGGWKPKVARRTPTPEIYSREDEEIRLIIRGESAAEANERLDRLSLLVDRAEQNSLGVGGARVIFEYRIEGSSNGTPLRSLIVGQPKEGRVVELPDAYDSATSQKIIGSADDPIIWRWQRRGALLLEGDNLVLNSSFEQWESPDFAHWTRMNSPGVWQPTTTADQFLFGTQGLLAANKSTTADRGGWQDITGLETGQQYTITVWARPIFNVLRLTAYDGGGFSNAVSDTSGNGTNSWERLSVTKTATGGGIRIALLVPNAESEGYFDGVKIEAGDTATDYHETVSVVENFQAEAAGVTNGDIAEIELAQPVTLPSPTAIDLKGFRLGGNLPGSFVVLSDHEKDIAILESQDFSTATAQFAHQSDSANFARGDSYLQFTPTVANTIYSSATTDDLSAFNVGGCRRLAVFFNARSYSSTNIFRVRLRLGFRITSSQVVTPWLIVVRQSNPDGPRWNAGGAAVTISFGADITSLEIQCVGETTNGTLGIDSIVLLNVTNPASYVMALPKNTTDTVNLPVRIDHQLLSKPEPLVSQMMIDGGVILPTIMNPLPYRGVARMYTKAANLYAVWLTTGGSGGGSAATNWRTTGGGTLIDNDWIIRRLWAHLTPR